MPTATEQLAGELRTKIVRGRWPPGLRLPDRKTLADELGTCQATLQEAFEQLAHEGFVEVRARRLGTRVVAHPPHLSRYRLIFPFGPKNWGQFWHAIEAAAGRLACPRRHFLPFYGLSGRRDIVEYQAIVEEVRTHRVAGLIFASGAEELKGTPLLEQPGIPRVAIACAGFLPGTPKVDVDLDSFLAQAIDRLLAQGRERIALLCASDGLSVHEGFRRALAARGRSPRRVWEQFASRSHPHTARHITALLMQAGTHERPDGLIVADDNLLTAASEGLRDAGVRVPEDLAIVAATNFPNVLPSAVPVIRLGFEIPALLDLLVLRLEQVRRGETPSELTLLPATFEPPAPSSRNRRKEAP